MLQRKINRGVSPPLFDRIVDDKNEWLGNQLLDAQQLKDSIVEELSIILNTRCTVRKVIYQDHIQTIPMFGFPDFFGLEDLSNFDGSNPGEWPAAALSIETAIQAAEPRLRDIRVRVESYSHVEQTLFIQVSAFIEESHLLQEIHFPLALQHRPQSSHRGEHKAVA
ncbi:MAG: type VI secretion system baseplate subunit TssE [Alphaproteobacteria bacterium]|nr:type VI secretion system baseplate subunit TssE [Alphaproteobacteria bacterium]